ncbi:hypothetical protein M3Y96_00385700 [Aphelenchoides besseyi]|nr:hypothetical protein M3Y96_00385700 [Aphelenchoides besseyi]
MPRAFPDNYEQQYNDWRNSRFLPLDSDLFMEFSTSPAGYYAGNAVVKVEFDGNGITHEGTHMFKVAGGNNSHFLCFRCQRHKSGCKASLRLPKRAEVGRRTAIVIKFHMHSRYTSDKYNTEGRLIKCVNLLAAAKRLKEAGVDLQHLHTTGETNDLDEELDEELDEDLEMVLEARTHFKNYFDEEEAMEIDEEAEDEEAATESGKGKESVIYVILDEDFDDETDSFLDAFASVGWVGQRIQSLARRGSAQRQPFSVIIRTKEKLGASMKYTVLDVMEDIPRHKRLQGENLLMGLFNGLYGDPNAQLANWVRGRDERNSEIVLLSEKTDRSIMKNNIMTGGTVVLFHRGLRIRTYSPHHRPAITLARRWWRSNTMATESPTMEHTFL